MLPKILLGVGLFATLFSVLIFSCKIPVGNCKEANKARGDVVLWGTLPEQDMSALTQEFNPKAKTYAVRYKYVAEAEFEQRLVEAIASGQGPDMIIAPYQTILAETDRITPFKISEKLFRDAFIDGASVLLTQSGALALPVSIEPMMLFYNRTLFSKHGVISPPTYWDEIVTLAPLLTVRQGGQFVESAIALGTPTVPYAKDILMTIVAQLGQTPVVQTVDQNGEAYNSVQVNEPVTAGSEILPLASANRFFTQFGDPGQNAFTWAQAQTGNPADFFVGEKLAMYIGYYGEYQKLRERNPRGDFQMTMLPQTRNYNTKVTGMRMYAIATLKTTKNPLASMTVEQDFASAGVAPTIARIIGGVPAFRTYPGTPSLDPALASSLLVARGWYDRYAIQSTGYAATMISDIINYRYGVNDATTIFIARLRDLYAKKF